MTRARRAVAALAAGLVVACGPATPDAPAVPGDTAAVPGSGNLAVHSYERNVVFARLDRDSVFLAPWLMRTLATPDTVIRSASGWIARGGLWDPFFRDEWGTPPTRAPNRILPHGDLSFLVREGDAIDGIVFEQGPRSLELVLGDVRATWVGPRGETFQVVEAAAYLSEQRIEGVALDMARASTGPIAGGDWAFLFSADGAHLVLAADSEHGGDAEPLYRGWGDVRGEALQWPEVRVEWSETEAFPPARRDIPVAWRISSGDGQIRGQLGAVSADVQAGAGPGPLLPVRALFEVSGQVVTAAGAVPVRGLVVHERR